MAIREPEKIVVDPGRKAQIEAQNRTQDGALLFDEAPTKVLAEYSDYSNVFLAENAAELPENIGINKFAFK